MGAQLDRKRGWLLQNIAIESLVKLPSLKTGLKISVRIIAFIVLIRNWAGLPKFVAQAFCRMTAANHDFNNTQCLELPGEKNQVFLTPAVEKSIPVGTDRGIAMTELIAIGFKNVIRQGVSDHVFFWSGIHSWL